MPIQEPSIIFEDDDIIVLDKPSGITVNKSETTAQELTMQDWVEKIFKISEKDYELTRNEEGWESEFYKRSGIVHRLDKETSGILLAAKNPTAFDNLQKQFKERIVEKSYIALSHGALVPPEGEINIPVGRLEYNRKRFGVVAGGRESLTFYKTITTYLRKKPNEILSLVELFPKTGRTHQIRVHLKHLNRPIFSDSLYGGRKTARDDRKLLPRLFLHAAKISFFHPVKKQKMDFESPLSLDLKTFLQSLQHTN
ncbi:MAG TPA: RluA family pseudouridine synthase [Candidatus Saccharimonadales bacterium]|nr:RluA family pseudouridine synthase [Candidatus Saccharimonadales bacterium]